MNTVKISAWLGRPLMLLLVLALAGCGGSGGSSNRNNTQTAEYQVRLINLTAGQPLSPPVVFIHTSSLRTFTIGEAATVGLEQLAEGGETQQLVTEALFSQAVLAHTAATAAVPPGGSQTYNLTISENSRSSAELSLLTMLVNTNDAFAGVSATSISSLAVNGSVTINGIAYDSGTEANTESAGTMPGPADSGEGFNSARDDIADEVRMHSGVVTSDDGLSTSVLTQAHRWDNPTVRIVITRLK
ncbi:spondin domain-containing protein [Endozoicomonas arenosclerae]|uniref:spondin domain-containing protein n=1 Tax=Endozoicomonas arenosclerae TaxID=1633495 RepID=UPI000783FD73|nr:spondin domain-containing protein [Endozoicomonas arenosclerae]